MKVSIVTISYNQAEFLERTIKSVIEQDHRDIEYIIVDPGSIDGSREIIERYRSRIDKIIFEPDDGPADGLNKGFNVASGEIFCYLNSDDILLQGSLSRIVNFFCSHRNIDMVYGHTIMIDKNDRKLRYGYSDRFSLLGYAYGAVVVMQPSTFFRSKIFRRNKGFNVLNKNSWDGELFVDMCIHEARFVLINRFLSCFRLHPKSITSSGILNNEIKTYHKIIFRKIMGRNMKPSDFLLCIVFRLLKHARNPRALYERLSKGPLCGKNSKN